MRDFWVFFLVGLTSDSLYSSSALDSGSFRLLGIRGISSSSLSDAVGTCAGVAAILAGFSESELSEAVDSAAGLGADRDLLPPTLPRPLVLALAFGGGAGSSDSNAVDSSTLGAGVFFDLAPIVPSPLRAGFCFLGGKDGLADRCAFSSSDSKSDFVGWFSGVSVRRFVSRSAEVEMRVPFK